MIESVYYHPYELQAYGALNAKRARPGVEGVLIRCGGGFGCIQTWEEFGNDAPLDQQLESILAGNPLPNAASALQCCHEDAEARQAGRHILEGLPLIPNHYSWMNGIDIEEQLNYIIDKGFIATKMKGSRELSGTISLLVELHALNPALHIRLDFNEVLDRDSFIQFAKLLPQSLRDKIDFVEDPCPYSESNWQAIRRETGMALGLDRAANAQTLEAAREGEAASFDLHICKPAAEGMHHRPHPKGFYSRVFTSYMDHPLGQVWAGYVAAKHQQLATSSETPHCGLLTQHLFNKNDFSEQLAIKSTCLEPSTGTGLGFDQLLDALPWKALSNS